MRITISLLRTEDRLQSDRARVEEMLFTLEDSAQMASSMIPASDQSFRWRVSTGSKPHWFGMLWQERGTARKLQPILVAGKLRVEESGDGRTRRKALPIIDQYNLYGKIRWLEVPD